MNTSEAISNLVLLSSELDRAANKPENYNTDWAIYLEQMSWSLYKMSEDLRVLDYDFMMKTCKT